VSATIPLTAGVAVPGPSSTRAARLHALADLGAAGWPTRRREQWRYTDLEPLAAASFDLVPEALDRDTVTAAQRLLGDASLGAASRQLVLLDGERVAGLGATDLAEVEVLEQLGVDGATQRDVLGVLIDERFRRVGFRERHSRRRARRDEAPYRNRTCSGGLSDPDRERTEAEELSVLKLLMRPVEDRTAAEHHRSVARHVFDDEARRGEDQPRMGAGHLVAFQQDVAADLTAHRDGARNRYLQATARPSLPRDEEGDRSVCAEGPVGCSHRYAGGSFTKDRAFSIAPL